MSKTLHRYTILRNQLDDLGYTEPLPKDGLRLVDRLVSDILKANEQLNYFKTLSNCISNERDALLVGTQPFRSDNAKLICEIDDLNLELKNVTENAEYANSKLKAEIRHLNSVNVKLDNENKVQQNKIQQLELELATMSCEMLRSKDHSKLKKPPSTYTISSSINASDQSSTTEMSKLRKKCEKLNEDVNTLLDSQQQQLELINSYKKLIEKKDQEISMLSKFLTSNKMFCSKITENYCDPTIHEYFKNKKYENHSTESISRSNDLIIQKYEKQLNEAISKQNETLVQNITLLEKNKQLEKELHDIDQIALNVEKRCNETLQANKITLQSIQDNLNASLQQNNYMKQKIIEIKNENDNLVSEIKLLKNKKTCLSQYVQTCSLGFSNLNSDCNYLLQNGDLIMSSERKSNTQSKQSQTEKHAHYLSHIAQTDQCSIMPDKECNDDCGLINCAENNFERNSAHDFVHPCENLYSSSFDPRHSQHTFSSWQKSYDKYLHTYSLKSAFCKNNCICNKCFHSINNLISCLDRKLNVLQSELLEVQTERNLLKKKLDASVEMQMSEHSKLYNKYIESQEKIVNLESENKEFLKNLDKQKIVIGNLQEHCNELKNQLCLQEKDINNQKISYNQLKTIYDQTEKTLSNIQQQLCDKEHQLSISKTTSNDINQNNRKLIENNSKLQMELTNIKMILDRTSKEKIQHLNELDDKCEQLAIIKEQKLSMESELVNLRKNIKDLKVKLNDISLSREQLQISLSKVSFEETKYCEELDKLRRDCKNYSVENMRLMDELTSMQCEQRQMHDTLESSKKESRELQQQLQQYVARVRHAEDVIAMKEAERSDLLEQFRSLSQEATILESNNQTLENHLAETQKKLNTKGHLTNDLEICIEEKEKALQEIQAEISSNSARFSTLDAEVEHYKQTAHKAKEDLLALRQVCQDLQREKDKLLNENGILNNNYCQIKEKIEKLHADLDKEISAKEGLDALLQSSRQEAVDYYLKVVEQTNELSDLHNKVQILMSKLENEKELSHRYQAQSHAYNLQLKDLRRTMNSQDIGMNYERDFYTTI